jgi:hypothetical protein
VPPGTPRQAASCSIILSYLTSPAQVAPRDSLSYLLTYRPRPEAGPHAIFLNFSPKEQRDFGFGLTVGLFDGIVQGGLGWNPFVSRADEGQVYYFFGSNLFGLLQEIGFHDVASEE